MHTSAESLWPYPQLEEPAYDCMCGLESPRNVSRAYALEFDIALWAVGGRGAIACAVAFPLDEPMEWGPADVPVRASAPLSDMWQRWSWPSCPQGVARAAPCAPDGARALPCRRPVDGCGHGLPSRAPLHAQAACMPLSHVFPRLSGRIIPASISCSAGPTGIAGAMGSAQPFLVIHEAIDNITNAQTPIKEIVTNQFPLEEFPTAKEQAAVKSYHNIKVLLGPTRWRLRGQRGSTPYLGNLAWWTLRLRPRGPFACCHEPMCVRR